MLVPFHFGIEELAANQFGIGDLLCWVCFDGNLAIIDAQLGHRHIEFFTGQVQQDAACFGGCIAQGFGATLNAQCARGAALVQGGGRVAHDNFDFAIRHVQLFGHNLSNGHIEALP